MYGGKQCHTIFPLQFRIANQDGKGQRLLKSYAHTYAFQKLVATQLNPPMLQYNTYIITLSFLLFTLSLINHIKRPTNHEQSTYLALLLLWKNSEGTRNCISLYTCNWQHPHRFVQIKSTPSNKQLKNKQTKKTLTGLNLAKLTHPRHILDYKWHQHAIAHAVTEAI